MSAEAGRRGPVEVNEQVGFLEIGDARKTLSKRVASEAKTAWIYVI